MDLELSARVALVTGGGSGLGRAAAERLLREGARVALTGRSADRLALAGRELVAQTGVDFSALLAVSADTTDERSVAAAVATVAEQLGPPEILVNAAARPADPLAVTPWSEITTEEMLGEFDTKLLGYLRCARHVAPFMSEHGWGRIVNVSGLAARQTGSIVGSARNVAVAAMSKNLADELGPQGINVNVVHPAYTRTETTDATLARIGAATRRTAKAVETDLAGRSSIGRLTTASEVADVIAFLASPRSVAITGESIAVGGGVRGPIYY